MSHDVENLYAVVVSAAKSGACSACTDLQVGKSRESDSAKRVANEVQESGAKWNEPSIGGDAVADG